MTNSLLLDIFHRFNFAHVTDNLYRGFQTVIVGIVGTGCGDALVLGNSRPPQPHPCE